MSATLAPAAASTVQSAQPVQLHRRTPAPVAQGPWSVEAIQALLDKPLMDLLFEAQTVHRQHWPAGDIELATLLSVARQAGNAFALTRQELQQDWREIKEQL